MWALEYDTKTQKVISNEKMLTQPLPVITFGEDEEGEVCFVVVSGDGTGILRFTKK